MRTRPAKRLPNSACGFGALWRLGGGAFSSVDLRVLEYESAGSVQMVEADDPAAERPSN
jgi:hypothetical protein